MTLEELQARARRAMTPTLPVPCDILLAMTDVVEAAWTLELEPEDTDAQLVLAQALDALEDTMSGRRQPDALGEVGKAAPAGQHHG